MAKASSIHWQCVDEQLLHPNGTFSCPSFLLGSGLVGCTSSMRELRVEGRDRGGKGTEPGVVEDFSALGPVMEERNSLTRVSLALRSMDTSFSKAWDRARHQFISSRHCSTSRDRLPICSFNPATRLSCSSSISLICSSSSQTRAARRSRNAL